MPKSSHSKSHIQNYSGSLDDTTVLETLSLRGTSSTQTTFATLPTMFFFFVVVRPDLLDQGLQ